MKEYISYEDLYEAYIDCRRRKRSSRNEQKFEMNESENLYNLYNEINSLTYKIGPSITFIVKKPVYREVFAADFRDRIIHHLVIKKLLPFFEKEFINDSYSCRTGKGTLYGIHRCKEQAIIASANYTVPCFVYKGDLKSYFMSINKNILWEKLDLFLKNVCCFNDNDYFIYSYLIKKIIFNDCTKYCIVKGDKNLWKLLPKDKSLFSSDKIHGIPIGNLTSQMFANFFLTEMDKRISTLPQVLGYGRYVDDFFVFAKSIEDLKYIRTIILEETTKIGITLHPKKCYMQDINKGIPFIGAIIKKNRIYVINRVKKSAFQNIKNVLEEPCTRQHRESSINSILGHLQNFNTKRIRKRIIKTCIKELHHHEIAFTHTYSKVKLHLRVIKQNK